MKKRLIALAMAAVLALALVACGGGTCKECNEPVYKDGLCEGHYALQVIADGLGSLFG